MSGFAASWSDRFYGGPRVQKLERAWEEYFKVIVENTALRSPCHRLKVGCLLVKDNRIIGKGYNQVESLNDSTAHAEMIAITSASNTNHDWRLDDCFIFVTKEPCPMCAGAILNSRIRGIVYGLADKKLVIK